MPILHFKDKEAYRKNMAYRHIHDLPDTASTVFVGGKSHSVKHSSDPKRVKIDNAQRKKESKQRKKG